MTKGHWHSEVLITLRMQLWARTTQESVKRAGNSHMLVRMANGGLKVKKKKKKVLEEKNEELNYLLFGCVMIPGKLASLLRV